MLRLLETKAAPDLCIFACDCGQPLEFQRPLVVARQLALPERPAASAHPFAPLEVDRIQLKNLPAPSCRRAAMCAEASGMHAAMRQSHYVTAVRLLGCLFNLSAAALQQRHTPAQPR